MNKNTEEVIQALDAPLKRSEISTREASGGNRLSYVSSYYVINQLNKTLGQGNWSYDIEPPKLVREGVLNRRGGDVFSANYICTLVLRGTIGDRSFSFNDVGYGDGTDKLDPGKAHELAVKEAVTDALKRCAKNLGQSLGLALYDKTQENVEDDQEQTTAAASKGLSVAAKPTFTPPAQKSTNHQQTTTSVSPKREAIKSSVKVLIASQKTTSQEFKAKYGLTSKVDDLPDAEVESLYSKVKTDFPELQLN